MKAYIDTEFNGFGGSLLSMAIVMENGAEWYEVCELPPGETVNPWVAEHVYPKLFKDTLDRADFIASLHSFLLEHRPTTVIADWPSDLVHFYAAMMGADHGETLSIPINAELYTDSQCVPQNPHNALSDAKALREWHVTRKAAA